MLRNGLARYARPESPFARTIQSLLHGFDLHLTRASDTVNARRVQILEHLGTRTVIDVGANEGQYAREVRTGGFTGTIVSIEPVASVFERLVEASAGDAQWSCVRAAITERPGDVEINVAELTVFSSILNPRERALEIDGRARASSTETTPGLTLDEFRRNLAVDGPLAVKIDVQGFEQHVLAGADETLREAVAVEIELPFVPVYEGEPSLLVLLDDLYGRGFRLGLVENVFPDARTGIYMNMNGLFVRA